MLRVAKTHPTNLQTWFGGKFWLKNEESFFDSAPIPFSWESGNRLINRFLKTEASLILKTEGLPDIKAWLEP